jgi:hypothetical protein
MARFIATLFVPLLFVGCNTVETEFDDFGVDTTAIDAFAWLAGTWDGTGLGGTVEESWSAPNDGQMVGHFTYAKGGEVKFYELMTIGPIDDDGTLGMRVKHFAPDLVGWEDQTTSVTFRLLTIDGNRIEMDGLTLTRVDDARMEIVVRVTHIDGTSAEELFRYRRRG